MGGIWLSKADKIYLDIAKEILENGFEHSVEGAYYADGRPVKVKKLRRRVVMEFDLQDEFPILTSKFVPYKTAFKELYWIWFLQSNDVRDLHNLGVHIWDEWMGEDYTIGKAYGYQLKKYKLVDRLINTIKNNPYDRGMVVSLWNEEDLPYMNIRPCAFQTIWDVTDNKLNCSLIQRSGDWGLGVCFNFTQYAILVHIIAKVTGLEVGTLTHFINNAHIYDAHYDAIKKQLDNPQFDAPKLSIPSLDNFYDYTPDDIQLIDYKHAGKIDMEIAIVQNPLKKADEK